MPKLLNFVVAAGLAAAACGVPAFAANLVVNGGFETGDFTGWTQENDTSFTGVDCSGNFGGVSPTEGACQAFFGPTDPAGGGIIQLITTVAGASYDLTFDMANLGSPPNTMGLFWDGGFVSIDFDQAPFPYTTFSETLIASGTSTQLGFIFFHQPSFFLLDNIVLEDDGIVVPEPAALALLGMGVLGIAGLRRRKA